MYRYEDEAAGGSFMLGLLAGVVLGAGVGLLFAPRSGAETRKRMADSAQKVREQATDGYTRASEKVHDLVERGREGYDRARQTVSRGVDEVKRHTQDVAARANQFATNAAETFDDVAGRRS